MVPLPPSCALILQNPTPPLYPFPSPFPHLSQRQRVPNYAYLGAILSPLTRHTQAQTPQQRLANERFAKSEAAKRGKPAPVVKKQEVQKAPISKGWVVLLAFVVCGGLVFELLRLFF
ncbi:hypothetical protein IWZ00DRAFT_541523 [Phyllosticta capitalensis]|uniref:Stress-associated endoplasmic reticulum protein n=1 Tax=Phyllosticta capitalensis TaxID=121624 RepID=A0ABR1Z0A6_9PEZI